VTYILVVIIKVTHDNKEGIKRYEVSDVKMFYDRLHLLCEVADMMDRMMIVVVPHPKKGLDQITYMCEDNQAVDF
jgi:hypothetical protein